MYGIIFDVDGVIADTEAVNAEASIAMFAERFDIVGVRRQDFEAGVGRGAAAYVQAAARCHGRELMTAEIEDATRIRQDRFIAILRARPLPPMPGVMELIDAGLAQPDRFALAIATSGTREKSTAVLAATGIPLDRMAYVNGDEVVRMKPDPRLFQLAIERLGLPPERCVVIEDAVNGIEAARAAGARCIAVTNSFPRERLLEADLVVDSLEEVTPATIIELVERT